MQTGSADPVELSPKVAGVDCWQLTSQKSMVGVDQPAPGNWRYLQDRESTSPSSTLPEMEVQICSQQIPPFVMNLQQFMKRGITQRTSSPVEQIVEPKTFTCQRATKWKWDLWTGPCWGTWGSSSCSMRVSADLHFISFFFFGIGGHKETAKPGFYFRVDGQNKKRKTQSNLYWNLQFLWCAYQNSGEMVCEICGGRFLMHACF